MSERVIVYSEMWLESSLQCLGQERAQLQELENGIVNIENCSREELKLEFYSILQEVRRLDDSLCLMKNILREFADSMEQIETETFEIYQDAKDIALNIFD